MENIEWIGPLFDDDRNILVKQKFKVVWMGFDFGWLAGWLEEKWE